MIHYFIPIIHVLLVVQLCCSHLNVNVHTAVRGRLAIGSDDHTSGPRPRLRPRDRGDAEYKEAVAKGKILWDRLQTELREGPTSDAPGPSGLNEKWANLHVFGRPKGLKKFWDDVMGKKVMPGVNPNAKAWYTTKVWNPPTDPSHNPQFFYRNYMSIKWGTILATHNQGRTMSQTGQLTRAPDRWSDVVLSMWIELCSKNKAQPSGLNFIAHEMVVNDVSRDIIDSVIDVDDDLGGQGVLDATAHVHSSDFLALLSSPNVVGTVYLLQDYMAAIGRKTVKSIYVARVYEEVNDGYEPEKEPVYMIVIELETFHETNQVGTIDAQ